MLRAAGVVAALLVCAWFALGLRQTTAANEVRARLARVAVRTPADAARTSQLLDRAGALNPDAGIDVLRADAAFAQGHTARARTLLLDVTRREPESFDAWATIAIAFARADPALAAGARAQLRRLSPPAPAP